MTEEILLSAQKLHAAQGTGEYLVVDCRFTLNEPGAGYRSFLESHIPGAVYAHLDDDLSSPATDESGRHPMPNPDRFAEFLGRIGWQPGVKLVAHDHNDGAIAARLWWLMKYFSHDGSAMLDGGFTAWCATGYPLESGPAEVESAPVVQFKLRDELVVSTSELVRNLEADRLVLVDARSRERFAGESEPIDRVAGHIPGAVNYPYTCNLTQGGVFKPRKDIREGLFTVTDSRQSRDLVHMCGSGVTACHNIFAAELAGMKESKLYVGSWSEWIQDPSRPVFPQGG